MRRNGRPLTPLLSGVCLVILLFLSTAWLAFNSDVSKSQVKYLVKHSRRALAYKITDTSAALFRIEPQEKQVELISNLDLTDAIADGADSSVSQSDTDTESAPINQYEYALEVTILDADLQPLSTQVFWERTRQTQWLDENTGNPMKAAYYLYESICSADSRITTINLPETARTERYLAVRLLGQTAESASVRLYKHLDLSTELDVKGLRPMPRRLRAKLERHNLFGSKLKKHELKRSMYDVLSQIPAETRSGFQYTTRQLFLYDHSLPIAGETPPKTAVSTQLDRPVFFPVHGPAKLKLKLSSNTQVETAIWRGTELLAETTRSPSRKRNLNFDFGPGEHLLKIWDPTEKQKIVYTRITPSDAWSSTDHPVEDPFPVSLTAYYRLLPESHGTPMMISIPEPLDSTVPMIKLLCRLPIQNSDTTTNQATLFYRYFSSNNDVIDSGSINVSAPDSDLARYYSTELKTVKVSNAQRWYLSPPAEATKLELYSDKPIDTALFTELNSRELNLKTKGPANSNTKPIPGLRIKDATTTAQQYFYFRPTNCTILDEANRKLWVSLPKGLLEPVVQPDLEQINVSPVSLYPDSALNVTRLFDPVSDGDSAENSYIRFNDAQPVVLNVNGSSGAARMGFHYDLNASVNPFITVKVGNRILAQFRPVTFTGYFELPLLESGSHQVEVSSSSLDDQIFMKLPSRVTSDAKRFKPRRVFKIEPGEKLRVPVNLVGSTVKGLNILAYASKLNSEPISLAVSTDTKMSHHQRPLTCVTSPVVNFSGNSQISEPAFLESGKTLNVRERFFFALHQDLSPDCYTIDVECKGSDPVFVRFFAMVPEDRQDA